MGEPWDVRVRQLPSGSWGVFLNDRLVSDHRDHVGARIAARNHFDARKEADRGE